MTAAGSVIAALGLVPLIIGLDVWLRRIGLAAVVIGSAMLGDEVLKTPLHHVTGHPALGAAAVFMGVVGLVVGGAIVTRWRWFYLLAVIATAPARIPFSVGHTDANLLVPLYLVIAAGAAATAWELVRGTDSIRRTGWVGIALAAFLGWSAISMIWTADVKHGGVEMFFFYLPFGLMVARLGQLELTRRDLRWSLYVQTALAVVFATVALGQELTHHVFWNPGIEVENTYKSFFRVNSLFWDASIYARFMAVTLVLLAGVAIHRRASPWLLALMAYLFVGMYMSYSQSGYLALAAGAVALGASLWSRRITLVISAAAALAGLAALAVALHGSSAERVTSGRLRLWKLARHVVENHPVLGAGLGGFSRAALAGTTHPWRVASAASHTTPLTLIAEQGPLGIVLYAGLFAAAIYTAVITGPMRAVRLTLLAALIAILMSSIFYNAYFEDPASWILIMLIAIAATTLDDRPPAGEPPA
jgi:hypothetical protein